MKTELSNGEELQDYTRTYGCPNIIRTDIAQSKLGRTWTQNCRTHVIGAETTEPHHPWQNPENSLKIARWLGIAHSAGDAMTYFIETEHDKETKKEKCHFRSVNHQN
jgi:hypothetical protein